MHILWAIIIGAVIGAIAKVLAPGRDPQGFFITSLIGIAGSLVATLIGQGAGWYAEGEPAGFVASVLGAVLILVGYHAVRGKNPTRI